MNISIVIVLFAIVSIALIVVGLRNDKQASRTLTIFGAVVVVLVAAIAIILPSIGSTRRTARSMQNSTQVRGIHMALIMQSKSNNGWYPGLDNAGNIIDPSIETRFRILLDNKHFASQYAISPAETKTVWTSGPVTSDNYSFSMLQLPAAGARHDEWRTTNNAEAPILTDRLIPHLSGLRSVHTIPIKNNVTDWKGAIAWNDNHTSFEPDFNVDTVYVKTKNPNDNLFTPATSNDAWMVYTGNGLNQPN